MADPGNLENREKGDLGEGRQSQSIVREDEKINAAGHVQVLERNFSLLSLTGMAISTGNVWPAVGGSILVALFNGGPPGVLYEFLVVSVFYWLVAASIAELASAIPSSGGVYHWASITPGRKWGRLVGFMAGWWNYFAWVLGNASFTSILANTIIQMYALLHPDFVPEAWHNFVAYVVISIVGCLVVCFCNRAMPYVNHAGIFFVVAGFFVTIIVLAVMPGQPGGNGYATSSFVWRDWTAEIGYPDGFVFLAGMLNGAYSVGTPDVSSHLAEEVPYPQRNLPISIGLQMGIGFVSGWTYVIVLMYAISDFDALSASPYPLAEIYRQGTNSPSAAVGLLSIIMVCIAVAVMGLYITCGRTLFALARDRAVPFSSILEKVPRSLNMPANATVVTAVIVIALGAIQLGNTTAFNALIGAYIILSSSSYLSALIPHLLTRRQMIKTYGPFHMKGWIGFAVNGIASTYLAVWFVIYCFPFALPVDARSMNYASVIWAGLTLLAGIWWAIGARDYKGPPLVQDGGVTRIAETVRKVD